VEKKSAGGVPIIQSGSGGERFGRIDLVWDSEAGKLVDAKTRVYAGVRLPLSGCDAGTEDFCSVETPEGGLPYVAYEGVPTFPHKGIGEGIRKTLEEIRPTAERKLGQASSVIKRDRVKESPLANLLTDALLKAARQREAEQGKNRVRVDVAMLNTGGIRADIRPAAGTGDVTYKDLFEVLPFNNTVDVVGPMDAETLFGLLLRSAQSCGSYGPLMQSGLKVTFERHCKSGSEAPDYQARLLKVEAVDGEVFLDVAEGVKPDPERKFHVVTLSFLRKGGSGFDGFKNAPLLREDMGIVRDLIADVLAKTPGELSTRTDGRWKPVAGNPGARPQRRITR
jgi:2',3'-cyclic-nucleotide 2'-phosphodiesterase (5'-nucleotidase family)